MTWFMVVTTLYYYRHVGSHYLITSSRGIYTRLWPLTLMGFYSNYLCCTRHRYVRLMGFVFSIIIHVTAKLSKLISISLIRLLESNKFYVLYLDVIRTWKMESNPWCLELIQCFSYCEIIMNVWGKQWSHRLYESFFL